MKRFLVIILSICLTTCLSGCSLDDFSLLYSDVTEIEGFFIAVNNASNCCFVGGYECTKYTENLELTIPDDYKGMPIKRIGGYYGRGVPTPFMISLADLYVNAPQGSKYKALFCRDTINESIVTEDYAIEDVVFNLDIGKNIEVIEFVKMDVYYPHINDDGSITFYHPVVNINCSDENKHFYSKDGKLYDKKTDELISDFAYVVS